jgi:pimeloyl-ACP methyl ester carboxylesterase
MQELVHTRKAQVIILIHGFPDNLHLYDRLSPYLSPPRRVVLFDFLGWGSSDKPSGYPYTADNQVGDLDAVITQLKLVQVVLVAHDASGPPAIDWALVHPERVAGLVLLNMYYCEMPTLRPPEAIWLFSTPLIRSVARPVSRMFGTGSFAGCTGGRSGDSSQTRMSDVSSCRCCIDSSMPRRAPVLHSFA